MKNFVKNWRMLAALIATMIISLGVFMIYNDFMNQKIIAESTKHLTEVYNQMKDTFKVWVDRNWNLLYTWKSDIESLTADEWTDSGEGQAKVNATIKKVFNERREKWRFSDFLFIDDTGKYVTYDGDTGVLELTEKQWRLINGPGDYVINVTLNNIEYVMFIKPMITDTIYGFEYEYTAIIYSVDAVMNVMNVESFEGNARCYITYADGECMFCDAHSNQCPNNLLGHLAETESISDEELVRVRNDFDKNRVGNAVFRRGNDKYYLIYVPTGVQDCMMAGIVPKVVANQSMNEVQNMSVGAVALVSVIFMGALVVYLIANQKSIIDEKNTKIMSLRQMFDILVENTDNVFIMFSKETLKIEYISSNVAKTLGIVDEEYIESLSKITDLVIDGEAVVTQELLEQVKEGKNSRTPVGYIHERTGEMRWYSRGLYCTAQCDDKCVLTLCDRTKERENNMHIQDALDLAKSANKAKSGFLSNVSHDIRTPMNAIIGLTTLIQNDYDDPEKVLRCANKIASSSKHLLALINNVLDMSKIESGKTTLNVKKFEFESLLENVREVIGPQTKAKEQTFTIECDNSIRKDYIGDMTRISQILINLLSNSVKYTDEGGEIKLRFYELSELSVSDSYAEFCFDVTDNGCGMAPDYIENVFEPFSRENNQRTEKVDGAGLGLAVVKNIVDLMGGTISVDSRLGEGTTFSVKIVLRVDNSAEVMPESENTAREYTQSDITVEETDSVENVKQSRFKVLVAEDYELNAEILVELLALEDIDADVCVNGKEALETFGKSKVYYYDYILMDVQMPEMDGYSATRAIRELERPDAKSVPIIAMTANAFAEDVQKALDSGMDAHVAKPIDMEVLKETMKSLQNKIAK